jgi:hypothetical protein
VGSIREEKAKQQGFDQAYAFSVFLGWMLTIFLVLATVAFFSLIAAGEATAPVGINHFTCYGFFRTCNLDVCIDLNYSVATGATPLPELSSFKPCTLNSVVKLQSPACIYDQNLYHQSQTSLGYDVCEKKYSGGVFIFEDVFDHWRNTSFQSNRMVSAHWAKIVNAYANTFCGTARGTKALSFRGEFDRYAETRDLDVSSGGRVEFKLFMPPQSYDFSHPLCRPGFTGVVYLQYSANGGYNWTNFAEYDPAVFRSSVFFIQKIEIPKAGWTNHTRFRFSQPVFESAFDNWALDDVKVLRYLPGNWQTSPGYTKSNQQAQDTIQFAQCCADTDWCHQRLSPADRERCAREFPWYSKRSYLFRLSEIMVCVALLVNLIKFIYVSITNYLLYHHYPFHDEFLLLLNLQFISRWLQLLPIEYRIHLTMLINQWTSQDDSSKNMTKQGNVTINETIHQIHLSARFQEQVREDLKDLEGQGTMLKSQDEIEAERADYLKKINKQKKKLAKRMKKKNFKASTIVIEENKEWLDTLEQNVLPTRDDNNNVLGMTRQRNDLNEGEFQYDANQMLVIDEQLPDDIEKLRRQNLAMLRIPFEFDSDDSFRFYFLVAVLLLYSAMFFIELSLSTSFSIYQPISVMGKYTTTLYMNGSLLTIFAGFNDFKEIYFVLKQTIPAINGFLPYVTIDLTDDNRALFIGHYRIPLANIDEITAFPRTFSYWNLLGIIVGVFPYSLFSLLLREALLEYETMRFVTPFIGSIMIVRAIMGPLFMIKAVFCLEYVFSYHFNMREAIGKAMQKKSTLNISLNVALGLMLLGGFFSALTSVENVPFAVVAGFFGGAAYGLFTGTAHELPVKPWICKSLPSSLPAFLFVLIPCPL